MDIEALEKLANLKEKGLITQEEFEIQKQKFMDDDPEQERNSASNIAKDKSVWDYFVECITEKYCCFTGRARRKEFWGYYLLYVLIKMILAMLLVQIGNMDTVKIFSILYSLIFLLPTLGVSTRRMHDVNFSGWWIVIPEVSGVFIDVVSVIKDVPAMQLMKSMPSGFTLIILLIVLLALFDIVVIFFKSDMKTNKYGPIPDGVGED